MAISPKELIELKTLSKVDKYVDEIDKELKENEPMFEWFEAHVNGELPIVLRNAIAKKYIEAGWHKVYHHTTSENGERPGFTYFAFLLRKNRQPSDVKENNPRQRECDGKIEKSLSSQTQRRTFRSTAHKN